MHRVFVITALMAFALLTGCQTTQPQQVTRADIIQTLDGCELAVNIALGFAQTRGADVAQLSRDSDLAFNLAREVVRLDTGDLSPDALRTALDGLRVVVADVVRVCRRAGVSEARIELLEVRAEGAFSVVERVIGGMEGK